MCALETGVQTCALPISDGARRGLARSDPQERTGADKVAVGKQRMAGDDALQDREAPLDDDAPELQQRGGRQLVGRRGLALADALQRLLRRLEAPAQAVLFRACLALRLKLFLELPGHGFHPSNSEEHKSALPDLMHI